MSNDNVGVLFPWTSDLLTGVDIIDEQHKVLVDLLNQLYRAMSNTKTDKKIIKSIFDDLVEYTVYHFSLEEQIMKDTKCQNLPGHFEAHKLFIDKINDAATRFLEGDAEYKFEIAKFLKTWLVDHIKGTDQQFMKQVLASGYDNSAKLYENTLRTGSKAQIEERAVKPWWKFW